MEKDNDWKWVASGVVLVGLMIGLGVAINLNYNQNNTIISGSSSSFNIDNGDLKIDWSRYPSYNVELSETYTITTSGTYYFSGTLDDGAIIINANSEAVVQIVLNGVTIKNSSGPAIACFMANDVVIKLQGENYLEDGTKYNSSWDEDVTGAIYSKSDLSFTGDGTLTLKANHADGIVSKDDLTFRSGRYNITAADDAVRGKDSVHIENGTFEIIASADGIKSTNETDSTKGFILIENGDVKISAGDDGITAYQALIIDGGTIDIAKSYEGLEAQRISVNDGTISIVANDDGVNAGGGADSSSNDPMAADENCKIVIAGGNIYINAAGDGIDSNGYLYFNGGTVVVDGPTNNGNGALDAGAGITINGGTVIAVGASGMAETLGSSSSVYNISVYFASALSAGTKIEIKNSASETVLSHTSAKTFNHLAAGTSALESGETYTIYINDSPYETFTVSGVTTTVGNGGFQNMGGGQNGQGQPGQTQPGPEQNNQGQMGPGQRR